MDNAENILVLKTVPGMAMACAAAIDSISLHGVLGCIAGDDTIMCVVKETSVSSISARFLTCKFMSIAPSDVNDVPS